jgi:hypothetical protein
VGSVTFDRAGVAAHANQLASAIQGNLKRSLEALGVVSMHSPHSAVLFGDRLHQQGLVQ